MKTFNCIVCGKENKARYGKNNPNKYCDNVCQMEHKKKQVFETWLAGEYYNKTGKFPAVAKDYVFEQQGNACGICGIKDWNGSPIVMQADHIDGDPSNLKPNNLRMICPNCHSQTDTWGRKGKSLKQDLRNIKRREKYHS